MFNVPWLIVVFLFLFEVQWLCTSLNADCDKRLDKGRLDIAKLQCCSYALSQTDYLCVIHKSNEEELWERKCNLAALCKLWQLKVAYDIAVSKAFLLLLILFLRLSSLLFFFFFVRHSEDRSVCLLRRLIWYCFAATSICFSLYFLLTCG